jgi:hypothetical protein
MKVRRLIVIASLLVAVVVLVCVALILHWQRAERTFSILPKLGMAVQSYSRDLTLHGQSLPSSVTLQDLASGGYISAEDVRQCAAMDITFYPTTSGSDPTFILVRVRMPDGVQIVALADGSVQELPR